jgi:hypothetical protein
MKAYRGSRGTAPLTLSCSTRWRWVVSFMPWPLYPGKETQYSLNWWAPLQSWHSGEGNNLLLLQRGKPKYTEKNLSQCHFIHHKSHMTALWLKLAAYGDSSATNCVSHGTTWCSTTKQPNNWTIIYSCVSITLHENTHLPGSRSGYPIVRPQVGFFNGSFHCSPGFNTPLVPSHGLEHQRI